MYKNSNTHICVKWMFLNPTQGVSPLSTTASFLWFAFILYQPTIWDAHRDMGLFNVFEMSASHPALVQLYL